MKLSLKTVIWIWVLATIRFIVKCGISVGALFQAMSLAWPDMTPFQRQCFDVSVCMVVLNHTDSFVTNVVKALKEGKELPPDDNGDTQFIARQTTATEIKN
jgi:hypothetical protein